ncbi:MAG: glycosyltransferase family 4 protein, partial [Spirulinaceae cyanobacterium]
VTQLLAEAWAQQGHRVTVVCQTPATTPADSRATLDTAKLDTADLEVLPITNTVGAGWKPASTSDFELIRFPSLPQLYRLLQQCDLYVQSCISLKGLWPWLVIRKPLVMIHHTWYRHPGGRLRWQDWLKLQVTRLGLNIAVSEAIAAHLPMPARVIENPYAETLFYPGPTQERDRTLVFVGRLVSDKGVDLLIAALAQLRDRHGLTPDLTLIGGGPERASLEVQIHQLHLAAQVTFVGELTPIEVAERLRQHRILVIPSRWREPFGIVALEGLGCGCWVVGSNQGGLPAAIGPGGLTFANGQVTELTACLAQMLDAGWQPDRAAIAAHLARHHQQTVAALYLDTFCGCLQHSPPPKETRQ